MTKDFYLDCIKVLEALSKKDDFEEDLVLSLSPKYGQAIFCKLEQEGIIDSTKDGWFVDDPDKLHLFLDECQSEINELSNHVNILRLNGVNPIYAALVLNSKVGRLQTEKACTGSAQAELYPSDLEKFLIPILPKDKQELIAEKVKQSFAFRTESKELLEIAKHKVEDVIYEMSKENENDLK